MVELRRGDGSKQPVTKASGWIAVQVLQDDELSSPEANEKWSWRQEDGK